MATFRCPTRQDFLQAVAATAAPNSSRPRPRSKSFAAPGERDRPCAPTAATDPRNDRIAHQSTADSDGLHYSDEDEDEDEVPPHLSPAVLDALDKLEETPELKSICKWLDDVRSAHNFPLRITDSDLSNGIALLDALYVIEPSIFVDVEYPEDAATPRPYVLRELDEAGNNAARNRQVLRQMLTNFPWKDVDDGGKPLKPLDFNRIDTWALGGFVVLAAYSCEKGREFATQMVSYDECDTAALEDVMCRGLEALGACPRYVVAPSRDEPSTLSSCHSDPATGSPRPDHRPAEDAMHWKARAREMEKELREEKRDRKVAERRAVEAERKADAYERAHAGLERSFARLTAQAADTTTELRRLQSKRGVLKEANGEEVGKDVVRPQKMVGRAVNQLRLENANLRRKVAELEKKAGDAQRELSKFRREVRKKATKV